MKADSAEKLLNAFTNNDETEVFYHGYAVDALEAALSGNLPAFHAEMGILRDTIPSYQELIQHPKKDAILERLTRIQTYEKPNEHPFLDPPTKFYHQGDFAEISRWIGHSSTRQAGGLKQHFSEYFLFTETELTQYLEALSMDFSCFSLAEPIGVLISNADRTVAIVAAEDEWHYFEYRAQVKQVFNIQQIASAIFKIMGYNDTTTHARALNVRIVTKADDPRPFHTIETTHRQRYLIDQTITSRIKDHATNLVYLAAAHGNFELLATLIHHGANIALKSDKGDDALHIAATHGHLKCVSLLIDAGADINAKTHKQATPLFIAARYGHLDCVLALINAKADIDPKNHLGATPFTVAAIFGHTAVMEALIKAGADINSATNSHGTALFIAASRGQIGSVQVLIKAKADLEAKTSNGATALLVAAEQGHTECVCALIEAGADVNCQHYAGCSALYIAAQKGWIDCVEALIKANADVDAKIHVGDTPLMIASQEGKIDCVRALLRANANSNAAHQDGKTALYYAAEAGHVDILQTLIAAGAQINAKNDIGYSPLFIAAWHGQTECVRMLIAHEADIHSKTNIGYTPLDIARRHGRDDCVRVLIEAGADQNSKFPKDTNRDNAGVDKNAAEELFQLFTSIDPDQGSCHGRAIDAIEAALSDTLPAFYEETEMVDSTRESFDDFLQHAKIVPTLERLTRIKLYQWPFKHQESFPTQKLYHQSDFAEISNWIATPLIRQAGGLKENYSHAFLFTEKELTHFIESLSTSFSQFSSDEPIGIEVMNNGHAVAIVYTRKGWRYFEYLPHLKTLLNNQQVAYLVFNGMRKIMPSTNYVAMNFSIITKRNDHRNFHQLAILHQQHYSIDETMAARINDLATNLPYIAAAMGHIELLKTLIQQNVNIDLKSYKGTTPLYIASQHGHYNCVLALIEAGANPNSIKDDGQTPVMIALRNGYIDCALALIQAKADVNARAYSTITPLMVAANHGYTNCLQALIDAGADINSTTQDGFTALYIAANFGHIECVNALIAAKADINLNMSRGATALYIAAQNGHIACVYALIAAKADVNLKMDSGATALYIAAQNGHIACVYALIAAKADVNLKLDLGSTALYVAAQNGHVACVNALIAAKADINSKNNWGATALFIAALNGYLSCVHALLEAGATHTPTVTNAMELRSIVSGMSDAIIKRMNAFIALHNNDRCIEILPIDIARIMGHDKIVDRLLFTELEPFAIDENQSQFRL